MKQRLAVFSLAALLCLVLGCRDKEAAAELEKFKAQAEIEEQNKATVLRWFTELSKDNFESLYAELFSPDSKQYMPPNAEPMSFEEYKPMAKAAYQAFPVIEHYVEDIIAEGDKVVAKVLVHAVHGGEFAGVPATGKKLEWTGIAIFQIKEGKTRARWEIADFLGLYKQLGLEPKPKEAEE